MPLGIVGVLKFGIFTPTEAGGRRLRLSPSSSAC